MPVEWLRALIERIAAWFPADSWLNFSGNVRALLVVAIVSVLCGAVGSLVVGNRMAFFSDALAHCAFAGVTLGMILTLAAGGDADSIAVTLIMVVFGVAVGIAIALIRERTGLANDTVIGVFFAFAVGFGGMMFAVVQRRAVNPETFLFGNPLFVYEHDIIALLVLCALLLVILWRRYNHFVLVSFSPSLARSRQIPLRWCNYLFIIVLALIVNLCLRAVGALLINAMLVVPAATAAVLGRNLRQMFWLSLALSLGAGVCGLWLSSTLTIPLPRGDPIEFGPAGTIVVLSVLVFFAAVGRRTLLDRAPRPAAAAVNGQ